METRMPNRSQAPTPARAHAAALALLLGAAVLPATGHAQCSLTNATTWCAHQDSNGVSGGAEDDDRFAAALAFGDFDGDGFDDLAVGAPGENDGAGFVHVFYSNGSLLALAGQQLFSQTEATGDDEGAEDGDGFGAALAAGDFNEDGFDDLAVGSPGEDLPEESSSDCTLFECEDAGAVHVLRGSPSGLLPAQAQFFDGENLDPSRGIVEGAHLGAVLAAGDFETSVLDDASDDLAIGAPDFASSLPDGLVYIVFGSPAGLNAVDEPISMTDVQGSNFGSALAAGQFADDDEELELVVGAPTFDVGTSVVVADAGGVYPLDPVTAGPDAAFRIIQSQYASAGNGVDDHFGAALAAGDFDGDGDDDLAAAAPNKNHGAGNPNDSGRVYVAYSDGGGPDPADGPDIIGEDEWAGDTPGDGERFGSALAAGDVDGDGFDDLLAGAPGEGTFDVGRVYLKRGSATGLTTVRNELFTQTFLGGSNGDDDHLGNVIALGDVDGDGVDEIALGVPDKDVGTSADAGMVYVTRAFGPGVFADGFESGSKAAWSASTP
jgi:hypothetical protein